MTVLKCENCNREILNMDDGEGSQFENWVECPECDACICEDCSAEDGWLCLSSTCVVERMYADDSQMEGK